MSHIQCRNYRNIDYIFTTFSNQFAFLDNRNSLKLRRTICKFKRSDIIDKLVNYIFYQLNYILSRVVLNYFTNNNNTETSQINKSILDH